MNKNSYEFNKIKDKQISSSLCATKMSSMLSSNKNKKKKTDNLFNQISNIYRDLLNKAKTRLSIMLLFT